MNTHKFEEILLSVVNNVEVEHKDIFLKTYQPMYSTREYNNNVQSVCIKKVPFRWDYNFHDRIG